MTRTTSTKGKRPSRVFIAFEQLKKDFLRFIEHGKVEPAKRSKELIAADKDRVQVRSIWQRIGKPPGNGPVIKKLLGMADVLTQYAAIAHKEAEGAGMGVSKEDSDRLKESFELIQNIALFLEKFDKIPKDGFPPEVASDVSMERLLQPGVLEKNLRKCKKIIEDNQKQIEGIRRDSKVGFDGFKPRHSTVNKIFWKIREILKLSVIPLKLLKVVIVTTVLMPLYVAIGLAASTLLFIPFMAIYLPNIAPKAQEAILNVTTGFLGLVPVGGTLEMSGRFGSKSVGLVTLSRNISNTINSIRDDYKQCRSEIDRINNSSVKKEDIDLYVREIEPLKVKLAKAEEAQKYFESLQELSKKLDKAFQDLHGAMPKIAKDLKSHQDMLVKAINEPEEGISFLAKNWKIGALVLCSMVVIAAIIALMPYVVGYIQASMMPKVWAGAAGVPGYYYKPAMIRYGITAAAPYVAMAKAGMLSFCGLIFACTGLTIFDMVGSEGKREKEYTTYIEEFDKIMNDVFMKFGKDHSGGSSAPVVYESSPGDESGSKPSAPPLTE